MALEDVVNKIKRYLETQIRSDSPDQDDPDAPFAVVTAPLKPRPPLGRSSIAVQPEQ